MLPSLNIAEIEGAYYMGAAGVSLEHLMTSLDTQPPTLCTSIVNPKVKAEHTDLLSNDCMSFVAEICPPREEIDRKISVCTALNTIIGRTYPNSRIQMFGSSGSNLCSKGSDVDMCLAIPEDEIQTENQGADSRRMTANSKKQEFTSFLIGLARLLERQGMLNVEALPNARVPIIKFKAQDGLDFAFDCDLSVNNVLACINTDLLLTYTMLDKRVRPLIMCIKHWVKQRQIHNAFRG